MGTLLYIFQFAPVGNASNDTSALASNAVTRVRCYVILFGGVALGRFCTFCVS